jgi:hypothetical protein
MLVPAIIEQFAVPNNGGAGNLYHQSVTMNEIFG